VSGRAAAGAESTDSVISTATGSARIRTGRLVVRGWRVFVPVVIVNAVVQAATTAPFATPAFAAVFVALAAASFVALVVSFVLVVAQAQDGAEGLRFRAPSWRQWTAGLVAVLVIGASAVASPPLVLLTVTLALIVLPAIRAQGAAGRGVFTGFRTFARRPGRAVALTVITLVVLAVLWLGALLSGFFITGVASAALTWLVFGCVGVLLVCAWTALLHGRRL
jgi:hypothetical protein